MYEIRVQKNRIRAQFVEKRKWLAAELRAKRDEKMCRRLMSLVTYRYADTVLMYAPIANEIDVMPIAKSALESGKTVAFPRCNTTNNTMEYYIVSSLDELTPGGYGILEPPATLPMFCRKERSDSICLVPALVYDRRGYRLGYGKGYYDRYLSSFSGIKVGLAYSDFIVAQLPRGKYDLAVDVLVTEKGVKALHHAG